MEFIIEDDVPVPPHQTRRNWPFDKLKVGQSFHVGFEVGTIKASLAGSASRYGKVNGKRLIVKKDGDGFRVWRVE